MSSDEALPAGTMLADHLRIERRLGAGRFGVVYLADDLRLDRRVAVKLLAREEPKSDSESVGGRGFPAGLGPAGGGRGSALLEESVERLEREARAMAKLADPHVAAVHEIGRHGDRPWIAMEYVDGGTARAWLAAASRSWREIVALYLQAGRGLAAAHAAGVVHRDFKPDNVLVAAEGAAGNVRVRVADFGLARAASSATIDDIVAASDSSSDVTSEQGLGTPAYMAPEQRAGIAADAAADQYALCAALFEALFGELPPRTHADDAARRKRGVPAWLRGAIARGLAQDPGARWPSVAALVDRLQRGLAGNRRVLAAFGATALASSLAATAILWPRAPECDDARAHMDAIWSPARSEALAAHFASVAGERGERAWSATVAPIDAWTTAWITERDASCTATRIDHVQSEPVLERSMRCFDDRAAELAAMLDRIAQLPADEVYRGIDAITRLPAVAACRSEPYLLATVAPPGDPATLAAVAELRAKLLAVEALRRTDAFKEALEAARPLRAEAEALGYDPVLAQVLKAIGDLVAGRGDAEEGRALLTEAHMVARRCGDATIATEIAVRLGNAAIGSGDEHMGTTWLELAREDIERGAADPELAIELERGYGHLAKRRGDFDQALAHYEKAAAMATEMHSARWHRGVSREDIANLHFKAGRYDESAAAHRQAIADFEEDYGPATTKNALIHGNYGNVLRRLGRLDEAIAEQRKAIALLTDVHGPESPILVGSLITLGVALVESRKIDEARRELEHALALAESKGPTGADDVGAVLGALGYCEMRAGNLETALVHQRRGLALTEQTAGKDSIDAAKHRIQVGHVLTMLKRTAEAKTEYEASLATWERIGKSDHVGTAEAWGGLASAQLELGEVADAGASAQRVVAIAERAKVLPDTLARARCDLARVKQKRGAPAAEVETLGRTAITALREQGAAEDADACAKSLGLASAP